jgi:hypothetical protein
MGQIREHERLLPGEALENEVLKEPNRSWTRAARAGVISPTDADPAGAVSSLDVAQPSGGRARGGSESEALSADADCRGRRWPSSRPRPSRIPRGR